MSKRPVAPRKQPAHKLPQRGTACLLLPRLSTSRQRAHGLRAHRPDPRAEPRAEPRAGGHHARPRAKDRRLSRDQNPARAPSSTAPASTITRATASRPSTALAGTSRRAAVSTSRCSRISFEGTSLRRARLPRAAQTPSLSSAARRPRHPRQHAQYLDQEAPRTRCCTTTASCAMTCSGLERPSRAPCRAIRRPTAAWSRDAI